jgi:hypothetical protein
VETQFLATAEEMSARLQRIEGYKLQLAALHDHSKTIVQRDAVHANRQRMQVCSGALCSDVLAGC